MPQPDHQNPPNAAAASDFGLSDTDFQRDQILAGRYRILSLLGRGGMGVVYRVEQIFLGQQLALKTIEKRLVNENIVRRFKTEAKAAFSVAHPNIVGLYDFGLLDDETPYIAMEVIEGQTLADRLKLGTLSVEEAIPIFVQVCFGLAHAHSCGVIHRDIKPSNIMLLSNAPEGIEGGVKILDFGVAKLSQQDGGEIQALTRTGEIFGSPLYMSPEQCTGAQLDYRADIYSLGCVLFEALTGTPPFIGENALATMRSHLSAPTPTLAEASLGKKFPKQMEDLVRSMLAKDPSQRISSLGDAAHILGALKRGDEPAASAFAASTLKSTVQNHSKGPTITIAKEQFLILNAAITTGVILLTTLLFLFFDEPVSKPVQPVQHELTNHVSTESAFTNVFSKQIHDQACDFEGWGIDDSALDVFKGYPRVQSLTLNASPIYDGLNCFSSSKVLNLKLVDCSIKSVRNVCKMQWLQDLDLRRNILDYGSLETIATSLKQLRSLHLIAVPASEADLRTLVKSHSLRFLELQGEGKYSEEFIRELHDLLPQCAIQTSDITLPPKFNDMLVASAKEDPVNSRTRMLLLAKKTDPLLDFVGRMHLALSEIHEKRGERKAAEEQVLAAIDLYQKNGDKKQLVLPLNQLAIYLTEDKNYSKAHEKLLEAFALAQDTEAESGLTLLQNLNKLCTVPTMQNDQETLLMIAKAGLAAATKPRTTGPTPVTEEAKRQEKQERKEREEWRETFSQICERVSDAKGSEPKLMQDAN